MKYFIIYTFEYSVLSLNSAREVITRVCKIAEEDACPDTEDANVSNVLNLYMKSVQDIRC